MRTLKSSIHPTYHIDVDISADVLVSIDLTFAGHWYCFLADRELFRIECEESVVKDTYNHQLPSPFSLPSTPGSESSVQAPASAERAPSPLSLVRSIYVLTHASCPSTILPITS